MAPQANKGVTLPAAAVGKTSPSKDRRRLAKKDCRSPRPAVSLPVSKLLNVGQDIIVCCGGAWQEAVVVKKPKRGSHIDVVVKSGWREHCVSLANVAVPLRGAKTRRVATPMQSPRARRGGNAAEAALVLKRSLCRPLKAGLDSKVMKETDAALHAKVDGGEAPGVISVVFRRGALAHLDCYGYADLERKVPFRPDTIIKLYSMTKCIVSVAAAMCIEDGLLQVEDPVSKYIPAFADVQVKTEGGDLVPAERPITVLHLLTHTAGLGYGPMLGDEPDGEAEERFVPLIERSGLGRTSPGDARAVTTLEQWCDELAKVPLQSQPGTEWFYSYSHDVAGRVIEVATGQRLDAFLQKRLLGPLGMVDTGFDIPREKWHRSAGMYRRNEVPKAKASEDAAAESAAPGDAAAGDKTAPSDSQNSAGEQEEETVYELVRIDKPSLEDNEWMAGNSSPILSGGGSVDAMTGGLVSTASDYSRFCLMLLRKGEVDGVRVLKPETVELLCSNHLPRATGGKDDVWAFGTPGVGFSLLGSVSVEHPELDEALRPGEYGWGGMAGTAWTNDPKEDFLLLSFSLVAFDLTTEEVLRAGVRSAIACYDKRKESVLQSRLACVERERRQELRRQERQQEKPRRRVSDQSSPKSPKKQTSPRKQLEPSTPSTETPTKRRSKTSPTSAASSSSSGSSAKRARLLEPEASPKLSANRRVEQSAAVSAC